MKSLWFFVFLISLTINFILFYLIWIQNDIPSPQIQTLTHSEAISQGNVYKQWNSKIANHKPSVSVVYIKPHPPDFLQGRNMTIQRFDKYVSNGIEIWRLEEVTNDNKVRVWNIDSNSIVW